MPDQCIEQDSEYFLRLNAEVRRRRIPLSGSLDLTSRCNLDCLHCYAAPYRAAAGRTDLSESRVLSLLDQMAGCGCLFLLLTGGEPLLRPGFPRLYRRARELGMLVTVFTNATLVTPELAAALAELPPRAVEVSVYGATPAVHDMVTRVAGSFERTRRGVDTLVAAGVRVRLKTVLMSLNIRELGAMEELARSYGSSLRLDMAVFPRLDGDRAPLQFRVDARAGVDLEMADPARRESWREFLERVRRFTPGRKVYGCSAGTSAFHVDPFGRLQPCLMTPHIWTDVSGRPFAEAWQDISDRMAAMWEAPAFQCNQCEARAVCGFCPAFFRLEQGEETAPSAYLCALGRRRLEALDDASEAGEKVSGVSVQVSGKRVEGGGEWAED